jgi:broad specificity phosphatase PhoE
MPALTIYYLRHGETEWNALGRLQGTKDIPLNARGRGQAVQAGLILADLLKRDGRDKAALPYVSSPLGRARQTMELARGKLELPVADYALDDRLREIGYGTWEGLTLAESEATDPDIYAPRRQMDGGARGRRDLCRCAGPCPRLVRRTPDRHSRGRPWGHLPGPDGLARPGDASERS